MKTVLIADAVRTPIGKHGGKLAETRPDDLASIAIRGLVGRSPKIDCDRIDDVIFGVANGAGEDNRNVARMASLLAGISPRVPGTTVNRLCGSGMEAVVQGYRAIKCGDASMVVAGGVESMSRAPWVLQKPDRGWSRDHESLWSTTLGWRMVNPRMPSAWTMPLGEGAELLARRYKIDRQAQDAFACRSHRNASMAWQARCFESEIVGGSDIDLATDESIRPDATIESLARLRPAFQTHGTVTAGNSSPLSDGASALLLSGDAVDGFEPLARLASSAVSAVEPQLFGIGPVEAAETALRRAGIWWTDLSTVELNEAFAAQSLACLAEWPDLDPEMVNPSGGAIALGHPLGSSGARILTSLAWRLFNEGSRWGLAAMCIGVGQGIAMVLEGLGR